MKIDQILQEIISNKHLELELNGMKFLNWTDNLMLSLKMNTSLTYLQLNGCNIKDQGAALLAEVLEKNTTLIELDLYLNDIGNHGVYRLSQALQKNHTLKSLYLGWNRFNDSGAIEVAKSIEINDTLEKLYLNSNPITNVGALELEQSLEKNYTLKVLLLRCNKIKSLAIKDRITVLLTTRNARKLTVTSHTRLNVHQTNCLVNNIPQLSSLEYLNLLGRK